MSCDGPFAIHPQEDATNTIIGRVSSIGGSGAATGKAGEGNFVEQADVASILCAVYDLDATDPEAAVYEATLTVADVIDDTPDTTDTVWTYDSYGMNFQHDLPVAAIPEGGHRYLVRYKFTLVDGTVRWAECVGQAQDVHDT